MATTTRQHYASVKEILKAGSADTYALTKGIDTQKNRLSGRFRVSWVQTKKMLAQLTK